MRVLVMVALVAVAAGKSPVWKAVKPAYGSAQHKNVISPYMNFTQDMMPLEYHVLARSGDMIGSNTFGMTVDKDGGAIEVSNNPDFSSILTAYNDKLYSVTHFESPIPGVAYFSELEKSSDGKLTIKSTEPLDFSKMGGLWIPCAGSVSPMGSHMGSEEYEPDAKPFFKKDNQDLDMEDLGMEDHAQMLKFFKSTATTPKQALADGYNPYMNGYAWETKVSTDGKPVTEKLWAMGRQSWELAYVMPDRKTVYGTDDGKDVIFSKFVAKKAGDMSEGHLYCAKFVQETPAAGGSADKFFADISWVDMGSAKASEILQSINDFNSTDKPTTFSDLFKEGKVDESG